MPPALAPRQTEVNERRKSGIGNAENFHLLRFFTTASLIAFVIVAALLGSLFRMLSVDSLIKQYEINNVNQAKVFANVLWDSDFEALVLSAAGKPAAELQLSPQLPALQQKVLRTLKGTNIFKIKVYDLKGMTVYSTELKQIGEDKGKNKGVIGGLRGVSSSELSHKDRFSAFEGEVQDRDLVETYVPTYDPVTGELGGVFEIYSDATSLLADIGKQQWIVIASVIALLAVLYLALAAIVKKAQNVIVQQNLEREKIQLALSDSEERWQFALEGSGAGVWDRNLETGKAIFSKQYRDLYGFTEDDVIDQVGSWEERVHPMDLAAVLATRAAYLAGEKPTYYNELRMRCKDGSWKWIASRGMVVARDAQGKPLRMIGTHTDITRLKVHEEELEHIAHYDVLTNLPNRVLLADRLRQAMLQSQRRKHSVAVVFLDLDDFKAVNDQHGHAVGDRLLVAVSARMIAALRESDTLARIGGDEFVAVLADLEQAQDCVLVLERLLQAAADPIFVGDALLQVSTSIGVSFYPQDGMDADLLMRQADQAMYAAKQAGRNRFVMFKAA